MTKAEYELIIKDVKRVYADITGSSEKAQLDRFLSFYDDSPHFLSFSADGRMSDYDAFKNLCSDYYSSLREQTIITTREQYNVIGRNLVKVGWTGSITAKFKNGRTM